ncbi:MAG: porin [Betaproteobacteria bacterium]|nr:MAG: porin [Betaproteobacteria bacterium]
MKRQTLLRAFSVAGLACGAAVASAQSSVTIYGRLNETVERQTAGGSSVWVLQNNSSRIGFKGTEDMGGGLAAGFQIEHGFSPDTGAANAVFWGRRSEVNLTASSAGTLRLGNMVSEAYYATADYVSMHNHDTGTSSDALYAYVSSNTNKVAYHSPTFGGATVDVARTLGEARPGVNPTYDLAVNWANGPLQLGAGYAKDGDVHQLALRGLYEFGAFTLGGYVQRDENAFAPAAPGSRTNVRLAAMYALGNSEFHVNVGSAGNIGGLAGSKASQATVAYNYKLSKRTKVYGFYTRLNDGAAGIYGGDFHSVALGIRHNF